MVKEFSVTRKQKNLAWKSCKKNKKCQAYVKSLTMHKEQYMTLAGLSLVSATARLNPQPSCKKLQKEQTKLATQTGYSGFCD